MSKKTDEPALLISGRKPQMSSAHIWARHQSMASEIDAIRRYIETVTSYFAREYKDCETNIGKQAARAPDNAIQSLAEGLGEIHSSLVDHFPSFALETTFVATYSLLEAEMLEIARIVGSHLGINLDPAELSDKGIHAAKKYLEKLCGLAFPAENHPWQQVLHYNRLRNVFAHRRGCLKKNDKKIRKYVECKKSIISINDHDRIKLSKDFCLEVLGNVEDLLKDLLQLAKKIGL